MLSNIPSGLASKSSCNFHGNIAVQIAARMEEAAANFDSLSEPTVVRAVGRSQ